MEGRIDKRFDAMDARFDVVESELRYFHRETGKHEARLNLLEKR